MNGEATSSRRAADESVGVAPGDGPIVVGIDGSDEARGGLNFAANLAIGLDRNLVAVHALGLYDHISDWRTPIEEYEAEAAELIRTDWCASLNDFSGLSWSTRIVRGEAVHTLLSVAEDVDASLLVIGSHGAGASIDPLLGSTSQKVLLKSRRPVLVVPPGADHHHERPRLESDDAGRADPLPTTAALESDEQPDERSPHARA